MTQFAIRNIATQNIESAIGRPDPVDFIGPIDLPPVLPPGYDAILYQGSVPLNEQPTPTAALRWNGTAPGWIEAGAMAALIASAVAKCYPDIDAVYADAIGNRAVEYTDAEADARTFIAGGTVTENVSSFAVSNPTGQPQTNQWAAEQIIARADAFKSAQVAMRTQRFDAQSAMRACATPAALAHVVYLWDEFITSLRAQLGLP